MGPLELTLNGAQTQWNIAKFVVEVTNRMIENAVCLQFFFHQLHNREQERNKRGTREEQERNKRGTREEIRDGYPAPILISGGPRGHVYSSCGEDTQHRHAHAHTTQ